MPLDDVIEDRDDYNKAALDYDTWDGKLWGVPYRIEALAVLCNAVTSRRPGSTPPTRRRPGTSCSRPPRR